MGRAERPRLKRLGGKLRRIRVARDLSQNQLIDALGLTKELYQGNISSYETGQREPPLYVILAYAKFGGVSTDVLIDDSRDLPR